MNIEDLLARAEPPAMSLDPQQVLLAGKRRQRSQRLRTAILGSAAALAVVFVIVAGVHLRGAGTPASPAGSSQTTVLPGGTEVTPLSAPVEAKHTGSAVIDLGPRPENATGVEVEFRCLSAGYVRFPDGGGSECDGEEQNGPAGQFPVTARLSLSPGQDTISFEAAPGVQWEIRSRYINERATEWKTNANGQTYGVIKDNREPDLQGVIATNGLSGYAFTSDLNTAGGPEPTNPAEAAARKPVSVDIPVYESDGITRIGTFHVGS